MGRQRGSPQSDRLSMTGAGGVQAGMGNDTLNVTATGGFGQIHTWAGAGHDVTNMRFQGIDELSSGHHVRGGAGRDLFHFRNLGEVRSVVVGRIEDFDQSRDQIRIEGRALDFSNLPENVRLVSFNGAHNDAGCLPQQWLLIDTGPGFVFYALEGARVDMDGVGLANQGDQEAHFLPFDMIPRFAALRDVAFVDPINVVPAWASANPSGRIINDVDETARDVRRPVTGTRADDQIAAGLNDDTVEAGAGRDTVWGGSGDDVVFAGRGNDLIHGGPGRDVLYGGAGQDRAFGNDGADLLEGRAGHDLLFGNDGDDSLRGGAGNDRLNGGEGRDHLYGQSGHDVVSGGAGQDTLNGASGNDTLNGGRQDDALVGGTGHDEMIGGWGRDTFIFRTGHLAARGLIGQDGITARDVARTDRILGFEHGRDRILFDAHADVDNLADLSIWRVDFGGRSYFNVSVDATRARLLVEVDPGLSWQAFRSSDVFEFT